MAALTPDSVEAGPVDPRMDDALPSGTTLDGRRYRLGAPLGRGGFGITYEAQDLRLRRPVAIKELFPDRARRDGASVVVPGAAAEGFARARQRFRREATTLARFGHPSIVRIFAVFEEHGTAYLVLERLDGQTLAQELADRRGPFSEAEALDVAGQVAAALSAVHRAGVLHRDVSPSNLVRTTDGRVVLIDFGLARPFADDRTAAMTRIVTPGYAPPEQYARAARFSARADVYALGATLHRLLSGRVPPDASARAQGAVPDPLWRVNPTVSRRVSDAVADALAVDPSDRPSSVGDLLDRLGVPTDDLDLQDPPVPVAAPDDLASIEAALAGAGPIEDPFPSAGPDGAGPEGATRAVGRGPSGDPDLDGARSPAGPPVAHGAGPDGATEHVAPVGPRTGPAPVPPWSAEATDDPADRPTEHVARSDTDRSVGPAGPGPGDWPAPEPAGRAPARPAVRPASHVVPAPLRSERRTGPDAPRRGLLPVPPEARSAPAAMAPPPGRSWVTLPLGLAATALASAQPATVTLVIGLAAGPVLATVGDRLLRPDRSLGWVVGWWPRNLLVGAIRSVGAVVVLGLGLCLWYGTEAWDALAAAGPWVLRATGVAAGAIMCLSVGRGGPGFRSHVALDGITTRLLPRGRLTVAAGVLLVICLGVAAAGLWFQPEAWPLGR